MDMPVGVHPRAESGVAQHLDRPPFEDAGTDSSEDVGAARAFDHHRLNPGAMQHMGEECAGGSGTDDDHLRVDCHPMVLHDC